MRRSASAALAALLALAAALAAPARAYVRTTDARTGETLSWPLPIVPWRLNPEWPHTSPTCVATSSALPAFDAVAASFAQWEQPCADLRLVYAGPLAELRTGNRGADENLVVFRHGWCSQDPQARNDPCMTDPDVDCSGIYGCFEDSTACIGQTSCVDWSVVALTSVLYDPATGRIMNADIEVNGWDGVVPAPATIGSPPQHGWYFTCVPGTQPAACTSYGQGGCAYMDLQNTLTHEIGHFIGLAHSPVAGATMFATTQPRETSKRDLSADDAAGVCAIYPQPSSGCGCGGGLSGGASLLLAAIALRSMRRKRPRRGRR